MGLTCVLFIPVSQEDTMEVTGSDGRWLLSLGHKRHCGFLLALLLSPTAHSGRSRLPCCEDTQVMWQGMEGFLPQPAPTWPVQLTVRLSQPRLYASASHQKPWTRTTQLSCFRIPDPWNKCDIRNVNCFRPLSLKVICHTTMGNWHRCDCLLKAPCPRSARHLLWQVSEGY